MRSDVLTRHMKQHSKRNESNSTTNVFVTNRAYDLIEQKQTHMVKSAKDKQASITHKKQNAQEYLCDECGELFSTAWTLERHVKRTHKFSFSVIFVNLKQKISKLPSFIRSSILKNIISVIIATKL